MMKKSHLLIDDNEQLILQTRLAVLIGDRPAIALQQVHYWADRNEKMNKQTHFRDGRWWAYNTWREWQQSNFPFWTVSTIRRIFKTLEENDLITTQLHEDRNSGLWVTVNYDHLNALLEHKTESPREKQAASRAKGRSAQNEQTPKLARNKSRSVQNEQTGLSKMSRQSDQIEQPTGNTETTETTTETKDISNASNSPLTDTPITDALSDGKSTVAAQDASHQEVIALADSTDSTPLQETVTPKGSARSSKRKEKAIVHPDDDADEPSPYYKPTQDERHAMFEAVCAHVFGVTDRDSIREMARGDHSRAGKIVSWLLRQNDAFAPNGSGKKVVVGLISAPANPQHVAQFAAAYKAKHRDASLPIDIVKFTDAWRAWASQQQRKQQAQQRQQAENAQRAADAAKPRATPEELAALKAEFEQMRRTLKEGSAT